MYREPPPLLPPLLPVVPFSPVVPKKLLSLLPQAARESDTAKAKVFDAKLAFFIWCSDGFRPESSFALRPRGLNLRRRLHREA